jgi:hypothetical protein
MGGAGKSLEARLLQLGHVEVFQYLHLLSFFPLEVAGQLRCLCGRPDGLLRHVPGWSLLAVL